MIELTINGAPQQFSGPLTVSQLIDQLTLTGKRVAIECNGEVVPRSQFNETPLNNGDRLEIIVAVGGG